MNVSTNKLSLELKMKRKMSKDDLCNSLSDICISKEIQDDNTKYNMIATNNQTNNNRKISNSSLSNTCSNNQEENEKKPRLSEIEKIYQALSKKSNKSLEDDILKNAENYAQIRATEAEDSNTPNQSSIIPVNKNINRKQNKFDKDIKNKDSSHYFYNLIMDKCNKNEKENRSQPLKIKEIKFKNIESKVKQLTRKDIEINTTNRSKNKIINQIAKQEQSKSPRNNESYYLKEKQILQHKEILTKAKYFDEKSKNDNSILISNRSTNIPNNSCSFQTQDASKKSSIILTPKSNNKSQSVIEFPKKSLRISASTKRLHEGQTRRFKSDIQLIGKNDQLVNKELREYIFQDYKEKSTDNSFNWKQYNLKKQDLDKIQDQSCNIYPLNNIKKLKDKNSNSNKASDITLLSDNMPFVIKNSIEKENDQSPNFNEQRKTIKDVPDKQINEMYKINNSKEIKWEEMHSETDQNMQTQVETNSKNQSQNKNNISSKNLSNTESNKENIEQEQQDKTEMNELPKLEQNSSSHHNEINKKYDLSQLSFDESVKTTLESMNMNKISSEDIGKISIEIKRSKSPFENFKALKNINFEGNYNQILEFNNKINGLSSII